MWGTRSPQWPQRHHLHSLWTLSVQQTWFYKYIHLKMYPVMTELGLTHTFGFRRKMLKSVYLWRVWLNFLAYWNLKFKMCAHVCRDQPRVSSQWCSISLKTGSVTEPAGVHLSVALGAFLSPSPAVWTYILTLAWRDYWPSHLWPFCWILRYFILISLHFATSQDHLATKSLYPTQLHSLISPILSLRAFISTEAVLLGDTLWV